MDANQGNGTQTDRNDHVAQTISRYEYDCIIRAAEHIGQAVALLRMANTPESRNLALEIQPFVKKAEVIA